MLTTKKLFKAAQKAVKKRYGVDTKYQISKTLIVSPTTVANWEKGFQMDPENARKIAVFANLDPIYAMACISAERAKDDETKATWTVLAHHLESHQVAA